MTLKKDNLNSGGLSEMERLFCIEYIESHNPALAGIKIGFKKKEAYGKSYELLQRQDIQEEINRLGKLSEKMVNLCKKDIIDRYMRIAFADITDFVEFGTKMVAFMDKNGPVYDKDEKPVMKEISYVNIKNDSEIDGGVVSQINSSGDNVTIKLEDRMKALEWLSAYFNFNPMDRHKMAMEKKRMVFEKNSKDEEGSKDILIEICKKGERVLIEGEDDSV